MVVEICADEEEKNGMTEERTAKVCTFSFYLSQTPALEDIFIIIMILAGNMLPLFLFPCHSECEWGR
jgi:hypothetical protein